MEFIKVASCVLLVFQGLVVLSLAKTTFSYNELKAPNESKSDTSPLETAILRKARQSRCIRCYDDRYADDGRQYSYSRNYYYGSGSNYGGASGGGGGGGGGSGGSRTYDDRNWYYYPDRYDSKPRYDDRYPERYGSRYDDRYVPRTYDRQDSRGYNDRYDYRDRSTPDFRGYGYDIPDKYYDRYSEGYNRDRYDRNRGGYEGRYYERDPYDRYPARGGGGGSGGGAGGYDYKNYRPWDETYRGTSGFDNSGRGYYFAGAPHEQPTASHYRPPPPPPPASSSSYGGRPYLPNPQAPPRPLQPPNPPQSSSPTAPSSSSGSPPSHHYDYNNRPPRPGPDDDSKGYAAGGWSYVNDRNKPNDYSDRNKDTESPPYGARPRPLGGSYLHDRDSNSPTAVKPISDDGKPEEPAKDPSASEPNSTSSSSSTN